MCELLPLFFWTQIDMLLSFLLFHLLGLIIVNFLNFIFQSLHCQVAAILSSHMPVYHASRVLYKRRFLTETVFCICLVYEE